MSIPIKVDNNDSILRDVFQSEPEARIFMRLFTNDVDAETNITPDDYTDANYVGYNPWSEWQVVWTNLERTAEERHFKHAFVLGVDSPPVTVRGWICTINVGGGPRTFIAAYRFPTPVIFEKAGDSLNLSVVLTFAISADPGVPVVYVDHVSFNGFSQGVNPMRLFTGNDRALVQRAVDTISRIRRRDNSVSTSTARSRVNRMPIIPTDEGATIDAFNRVEIRLNEMLGMQRS